MSGTITTTPHNAQHCKTWTRDGFLISTDPFLIHIPTLQKAFDSDDMYWARSMPEPEMRTMLDHSFCFGLYSPTPSPPPAPGTADAMDSSMIRPLDPSTTLHEIAEGVHRRQQQQQKKNKQGTTTIQGIAPTTTTTTTKRIDSSEKEKEDSSSSSLIGFARGITDRVTFFYLTDVWVSSEWRGQGLGKWLISCVQEVVGDMEHLRRCMLVIGQHQGGKEAETFYAKSMKMERLGEDVVPLHWKGPGCTF
ncbi:hypothetical protein H2204_008453 [Knufia peltigerae]|uniref:N-acetyltransferase domain-containing protein n=1 Tax=Knufia peltigerae TaxID=1002370 RepID=A0AA38XZY1_9EURO|nr:hypothetical protein H2204_008453 [Knufia peltigerae]